MSITLAEVIRAARSRHWAFTRERVPDRAIGEYLSDAQNELLAKATRVDKQFMAQTAVVSVAPDRVGAPSAVGAGSSLGLPGTVDSDGDPAISDSPAGSLIEAGLTAEEGATVLLSDQVPTSATATSITVTGAGRTVDDDIDLLIVIRNGTGAGQRREVVSNTADTWTFAAMDPAPDDTSLFDLIQPALLADDTAGVFGALPAQTTNTGYVVKLDAQGQPYIDYTQPVTATLETGVPLPPFSALLPTLSQYYRRGSTCSYPLHVVNAVDRHRPFRFPAVYVIGSTLYACGHTVDWTDIASLELRYLPIAPAFTGTDGVFLLPDSARPALVAMAAAYCAMRVQGLDVQMDPTPHGSEADRAQKDFIRTVILNTRGRGPSRIREDW